MAKHNQLAIPGAGMAREDGLSVHGSFHFLVVRGANVDPGMEFFPPEPIGRIDLTLNGPDDIYLFSQPGRFFSFPSPRGSNGGWRLFHFQRPLQIPSFYGGKGNIWFHLKDHFSPGDKNLFPHSDGRGRKTVDLHQPGDGNSVSLADPIKSNPFGYRVINSVSFLGNRRKGERRDKKEGKAQKKYEDPAGAS
jgi:hypothetical protein